MTKANLWQNMNYSDSELDIIGDAINHDLDLTYPYNQLFQIKNKYALTNRATGKCYETHNLHLCELLLGLWPYSQNQLEFLMLFLFINI